MASVGHLLELDLNWAQGGLAFWRAEINGFEISR